MCIRIRILSNGCYVSPGFYHHFISPHMWQDMICLSMHLHNLSKQRTNHKIQLGGDIKRDKNPMIYSISNSILTNVYPLEDNMK